MSPDRPPLEIRQAEPRDLNRLVEIYNYYVVETHVTFDTEPFAVGARTQWFTRFGDDGPYRLFVGERDGSVVGYASSLPFKDRAAYNTSVETTIYLAPEATGNGLGRVLYAHLLRVLGEEPSVHRAYGGVALPNPQSIRLHVALGFVHVASYHEVGFKFGEYWDVNWYEKDLSGP
jgi:phosphinothricin acetyltransferase